MKKLFLSLLLLIGIYGTTKPMGFAAVLGAAMTGAPAVICAFRDLSIGPGHVVDRFNRSCVWIARGCALGAYTGFAVAPLAACSNTLPVQCTESSILFATIMLTTLTAMENGVRYTNEILKHSNLRGQPC